MINVLLKSIVKKKNVHIDKSSTLRDLIRLMNLNGEGAVIILNENKPEGIVTERDIVNLMYHNADLEMTLDRLVKKQLIATRETRPLGHALNLMTEHNIRRLIITDDEDNFIGIVTQQDMLQYIEDDYYRSSLKVKHIIESLNHFISITCDSTLRDVLNQLVTSKISAVPVIENGKAVGIITEKDILRLADDNISLDSRVSSHMSQPVTCTNLDSPLIDIVKVMTDNKIRRVVINDEKGIAINILTIRDIFRNAENDYSKFLERKLKNAKEILNLLPEMLIEITDTGEEQLIIWANEKFLNKIGREIIDKPITHVIPSEQWNDIYHAMLRFNGVEHIKFKNNNDIYELSGYLINTDQNTEKGRFQLVLRDITEDVILTTTDSLTGVYNRRFINEFMQKEIERSKRAGRQLSFVICDINNFKTINDRHGHPAGDAVLQAFSRTLSHKVRNSDVVGRYGGDEFVIILPETSKETAEEVVHRIRDDMEPLEVLTAGDETITFSASFGIATYPDDGMSSDELLIKSDSQLYMQKHKRKEAEKEQTAHQQSIQV